MTDQAKIEPFVPDVTDGSRDPHANYSLTSLLIHWLGAGAVIILWLTHEDGWMSVHVGLGLIAALPLLWRIWYRFSRGFARPPDQALILNFLARTVMIGMLFAIGVAVLTGLVLPALENGRYDLFGIWSFDFRLGGPRLTDDGMGDIVEEVHELAGNAILVLFALHFAGFIKHRFIDKHGNKNRMLRPMPGGK